MTEKQKAMRDVQERGFAAFDASLYLDSHPDDEAAVQYFRTVCKKHQQAQEVYQKHFGPLTRQNAGAEGRWNWVDDPWPWEEV